MTTRTIIFALGGRCMHQNEAIFGSENVMKGTQWQKQRRKEMEIAAEDEYDESNEHCRILVDQMNRILLLCSL